MNTTHGDGNQPPRCPDHPWYKGVHLPTSPISGKKPCICSQIWAARQAAKAVAKGDTHRDE